MSSININKAVHENGSNSQHHADKIAPKKSSRQHGKSRPNTQMQDIFETMELITPIPGSKPTKARQPGLRTSTVNEVRPYSQENKEAPETEEEHIPTLEERRQELVKQYYHEVRVRAREFVAKRKIRLKRMQEAAERGETPSRGLSSVTVDDNNKLLPTIEESRDEIASKHNKSSENSNTARSVSSKGNMDISPNTSEDFHESGETKVIDEDVVELEKDAENGIAMEDFEDEDEDFVDEEGFHFPPELASVEIQAMHEAVMEGELELLDDLLDLPGASLEVLWFGENLLMTAIRAGQTEISTFLIDNGIDVNFKAPRFERRDDMEVVIESKQAAAQELLEQEKQKKKNKKKTKLERERSAIEELEKVMSEERVQILTPEHNPPRALTDMDMFMISCRDVAIEHDQREVVDLIDAKNGDLWPKDIHSHSNRTVLMKQSMMGKLELRDDWVHTEVEDDSQIALDETLPDLGRNTAPKYHPIIDRSKTSVANKTTSNAKGRNSVTDKSHSRNETSEPPSRLTRKSLSRNNKKAESRLSNKENQQENFANITVAGETEVSSPPPVKEEEPLEIIYIYPDEGPKETRLPYTTTKSFVKRKALNDYHLKLQSNNSPPKTTGSNRLHVKSHGSFMSERQAWTSKVQEEKNNQKKVTSSKRDSVKKAMQSHVGLVESFNDQSKYQKLRPSAATRKMSPWTEDDPVLLSNYLKRSNSQIITRNNSPRKSMLDTADTERNTVLRSQSNPSFGIIRTNSNLYSGTRSAVKSQSNHSSKKMDVSKPRRSKSPGVVIRQSSDLTDQERKSTYITQCRSTILFSPPKPSRLITKKNSSTLLSLLESNNNKTKSHAHQAWTPRLSVKKSTKTNKRYSPAGYLKSGRTKSDFELLNQTMQKNDVKPRGILNSIG